MVYRPINSIHDTFHSFTVRTLHANYRTIIAIVKGTRYEPWLAERSTVRRTATTSGAWASATTWACPRNTPPRSRTSLPIPPRSASRYQGPTCRGLSAFPACPDARRAGRGGREGDATTIDRYSYLRKSLALSRGAFCIFFLVFSLFGFVLSSGQIKRVQSVIRESLFTEYGTKTCSFPVFGYMYF